MRPATHAPSDLNDEQQHAVELAEKRDNVFVTGGAGTGKSFVLKRIEAMLKGKLGASAVCVVASTGIAADPHDGETLHALLGLHIGKPKEQPGEAACGRLKKLKALVIDEISMIDGDLFGTLDRYAKVWDTALACRAA